MKQSEFLKKNLKRGQVYRRADLAKWSKSVDRHVQELMEEGTLKKVSPGVYYYPKQTVFGEAPAEEEVLIKKFLKDDRFLLTSPNAYNTLGVGTTQLYNKRVVYNHKRHGEFKLGNRMFDFRIKPHFPKRLTTEYLLVDLVNNLDTLAEDSNTVLSKVMERAKTMDVRKLRRDLSEYGNVKTKKLLTPILEETKSYTHAR